MRLGEVRIHLKGILQLFSCLVVLARVEIVPAEMDTEENIVRLKLQTATAFGQGFLNAAHGDQEMRIVVMSFGISRVQLNGSLEFYFRSGPVPIIVEFHERERSMRFSERAINRERLH